MIRKKRFAPFCLPRSLLHWTTNTTQTCYDCSQHMLACKSCFAKPALLPSLRGWGKESPLLCQSRCHAWLLAHHPFTKSPLHAQGFCSAWNRTTCAREHSSVQQWFSREGEISGKLSSWKSYEWHQKENMAFIAIWEKKKGVTWFWVLSMLLSWHTGKIIRPTRVPKTCSIWAHALADTAWLIKLWHLKVLLPLAVCPLLVLTVNTHIALPAEKDVHWRITFSVLSLGYSHKVTFIAGLINIPDCELE